MDEVQTQAASSPAPEVAPAATEAPNLSIPRSGTPEYAEWRNSGKLPEPKQEGKPKEEADNPADGEEQIPDDSADSAANQKQEQEKPSKRRPDVESRIKKLTDELNRTKAELDEIRKPKTEADSSPAKPAQPKTYAEWNKEFDPEKWIEEYGKANPDHSYEKATSAMYDHKLDMRDQFRSAEQMQQTQMQNFMQRVGEAEKRYPNFGAIADETAGKILQPDVPQVIREMFKDSDVFEDLVYTLGSDEAKLAEFVEAAKKSPSKAARALAEMERDIQKNLSNGSESSSRDGKGQFTAKTEAPPPAKRGPESATPPPIEIGHRGSGAMDESDRALKEMERGNSKAFSSWKAAEDRKALSRR